MDKIKKMLPYLMIMVLDFYLLPFLIGDTGSAMVMLLAVVPLICLICAAIYGVKYGFNLLFCGLVTMLYVPTIYIFYNASAWVYVIGYGVVVIIGNALGIFLATTPSEQNKKFRG